MRRSALLNLIILVLACGVGLAQTTAFTYQGKLTDGGSPPTGQYDFKFRLFDLVSGGTQIGADVLSDDLQVTGGVFTVNLDFGASPFTSGAPRYLEIAVRAGASTGAYTTLAPRQLVTANPYAIKSLNAASADGLSVACVNCVTSSQISSVAGSQVSGAIPIASVPAGSGNYIQNNPASAQTSSNFNIAGNGTIGGTLTGNAVNATTQFNIGGNRVLSVAGTQNVFAGVGAGGANTLGTDNSFFGTSAGFANAIGSSNSFFGMEAGFNNTNSANSFFGRSAGFANTTGSFNSFFGLEAGFDSTGSANSFFGSSAGFHNTAGSENSFFGTTAGFSNTTGSSNSFFGRLAGTSNTTGTNNTLIGSASNVSANNLTLATAIGAGAVAGTSNTVVLGRASDNVQIPGTLNVTGGTTFGGTIGANIVNAATQYNIGGDRILAGPAGDNVFAGRTAGLNNTSGIRNSFFGNQAGEANLGGSSNSFFGERSGLTSQGINNSFFGAVAGQSNVSGGNNTIIGTLADVGSPDLTFATAIGAGAVVSSSDTVVLGRTADRVEIPGALNVTGIVGIGTAPSGVASLTVGTTVRLMGPGSGGSSSLCLSFLSTISVCSSSIRYKQNINSFRPGLALIQQLRPVSFNWRANNQADLGLVAEEVAKVDPLLTTTNAKGEIEGVKYDRIGVVLVNAVQEQQQQIETQRQQINRQQKQIDELKQTVCAIRPDAAVCKETNK